MITLESIFSKEHLKQAMQQVVANKGAPGMDGLPVEGLLPWIKSHPHQLTREIMQGTYHFTPIKRVFIPKPNGKKRPLGIPSVVDRLVQQAIAITLSEEYDGSFSEGSYGFRPNRGAHDAVKAITSYLNEGYTYVIDLDLKSFFDTVNHEMLLRILADRIKDTRVLKLINKILKTKIVDGQDIIKPTKGLTQGAPCSPVLANILLDKLDRELEARGHKFCRYADDVIILCKSQRAAERTYESVAKFIEGKLHLTINKEKTQVCPMNDSVKYLGFGFYRPKLKDGTLLPYRPTVHMKAKAVLKDKLRILLNKKCPGGIDKARERFNQFLMGWAHYFALGITDSNIKDLDGWIRRKIRAIYIKSWKRNATIDQNLRALKTNKPNVCYTVANSSRGVWAKALHANKVITNKVILNRWGWKSIKDIVERKSWKVLGH